MYGMQAEMARMRAYQSAKIVNIVLALLIVFHLIFGIYLLVPIVSPKIGELEKIVQWDGVIDGTEVWIKVKAETKYKLEITDLKLKVIYEWGGVDTQEVRCFGEGWEILSYPLEETNGRMVRDVAVYVVWVKTESMTEDIVMMCLSFGVAIIGTFFLIKKIEAEKLLPHIEKKYKETFEKDK